MLKIAHKAQAKLSLFARVLAEEPTKVVTEPTSTNPDNTPPPVKEEPKPSGQVNFEELISKARKEEKDKLYPQIETYKKKNNDLLLVVGERDKEITDLKKEVETLKSTNKTLEDGLKDGKASNKELTDAKLEIDRLKKALEDATVEHENKLSSIKLENYKTQKIAEAQGQLIPELVTGNTEEEINASLEASKQRYAQITQGAVQQVQMPVANPGAQAFDFANVDIADVQNMPISEYEKLRKTFNLR
jgi:predicted RNase H-like nuclease (RuvC/YqgF family)